MAQGTHRSTTTDQLIIELGNRRFSERLSSRKNQTNQAEIRHIETTLAKRGLSAESIRSIR